MEKSKVWIFLAPLGVFIALAALLFNSLGNDPRLLPSAKLGRPVPVFNLPVLGAVSEEFSQENLKGHVSLLNVWATWCPSCRVEHPVLNQLAESGVVIYGLNYKDKSEEALNYLQQLGNPYQKVIYDKKGDLGLDLGVYGAPETYIIDAEGLIVYRHVGVVSDEVWVTVLKPLMDAAAQSEQVPSKGGFSG